MSDGTPPMTDRQALVALYRAKIAEEATTVAECLTWFDRLVADYVALEQDLRTAQEALALKGECILNNPRADRDAPYCLAAALLADDRAQGTRDRKTQGQEH